MFAVSQFTTMPQSAEEDIKSYAAAGVEAIELCEAKFPESKAKRRECVARLRDTGIKTVSVQAQVHSLFPDRMAKEPRSPRARLEKLKESIDFWMEALESPDLPFVLIAGVVPDQDFREGWRTATALTKDLATFAESRGARIAFEPLGPGMMYFDTFIYGLDQGLALIDAGESEALGLVVDAWHVWEEHGLEARLQAVADRVFVVHACDFPKGHPRGLDDRVIPGDGVIPLREKLFEPLRAGGFRGPFIFELLSDESLPDSLWKLEASALLGKLRDAYRRFPE